MKASYHHFLSPVLVALVLAGCVPAGQTIAALDQQTAQARNQHVAETGKRKQLLSERRSLESELAANNARIRELKAADPNGADATAQAEIRQKEQRNAAIRKMVASSF